ncbi:MAG: DUF433 domain-containing protein [Gemmataceae bacterium]|nr:DUF433 domain-containing protein [Gemmataceae bacterium]
MNESIAVDNRICHGKPVVRGTRTPVIVILDALSGGDTCETIMDDYRISIEDIHACIAFASSELSQQSFHLLPS